MSTLKQRRVAKLVETGSTMKEAMIRAGYSPNTAVAPTKVTKSKAWPQLMEERLPDDKLLEVHNQGLEAVKIHGSLTEPDKYVPDIPTRLKAVELGYKVKGRLSNTVVAQQFNVGGEMTLEFTGNDEK
jgi:hypothetical protein